MHDSDDRAPPGPVALGSAAPQKRSAVPEPSGGRRRHGRRSYGRGVDGRGRIVVPSLLAGAGLALSLPPWGFWILAIPAAGLLSWRLRGLRWRTRALAGWLTGLGLFVPGLWWALQFNVYGGVVLMVVESLALSIACLATPPGRGRTPALAGAMVLAEALRSTWPFGGLPLGGIALGQAAGPLAPAARLGGPLLVTGLVWLAGAGFAALVTTAGRAWWARRQVRRPPAGWHELAGGEMDVGSVRRVTPVAIARPLAAGIVALAVTLAVAGWGFVAGDGGPAHGVLRVAAVQGGGPRGLHQSQVDPATVFAAQVAATRQIPSVDGGRPPQLILWPEDVVALDGPLAGSSAEQVLSSVARAAHATLVTGVTEDVGATRFRNEVVAFSPTGHLVARYEKVHRVPFGEYVPWRGFFEHLANLSEVPRDAIPGHGAGVLLTPAGRLGTMVSYEVFFADRGRIPTRAGAEVLIVPTNTSSYSTSQVPTQEVAAARLQALSDGRDLVQAAPTGFSAFIDRDGSVLHRSVLGAREVLVGDVTLFTGRTWYVRTGDTPVLVVAALMVIGGWVYALTDAPRSEAARRERSRRPAPRRRP